MPKPSPDRKSIQQHARKDKAKGIPKDTRGRAKPLTAIEIEAIFATFSELNPEPKGELEHINAYTLLVAVVLSAQATDAGVNKATRGLFALADTPAKDGGLGEDKVRDLIKTIGLYPQQGQERHRAVAEAADRASAAKCPWSATSSKRCRASAARPPTWSSTWPSANPPWRSIRTSSASPTALACRAARPRLPSRLDLSKKIPERYAFHAHHWLILHGRYLCKARVPECWRCPIAQYCRFEPRTPAPDAGKSAPPADA